MTDKQPGRPPQPRKRKGLEPVTAADLGRVVRRIEQRDPMFHAVRQVKPKTEAAHTKLIELQQHGQDKAPPVIGYILRMMVLCTLPHGERTEAGGIITRTNGRFTLSLEPRAGKGIPYGIYPRLIMAYLTQEVQRTKRREISLGSSLTAFMNELGVTPTYGKRGTVHHMRDQMERLFSARVWLEERTTKYSKAENASFAQRWALWWEPREDTPQGQPALFESSVTLSEELFQEMLLHPVPFDKTTLAKLKDSALGVDLYLWASYRTSYMQGETVISWAQLAEQLGADYSNTDEFARKVKKQLARLRLAWPELKFSTVRGRLVLKPSAPHVPKLGAGD